MSSLSSGVSEVSRRRSVVGRVEFSDGARKSVLREQRKLESELQKFDRDRKTVFTDLNNDRRNFCRSLKKQRRISSAQGRSATPSLVQTLEKQIQSAGLGDLSRRIGVSAVIGSQAKLDLNKSFDENTNLARPKLDDEKKQCTMVDDLKVDASVEKLEISPKDVATSYREKDDAEEEAVMTESTYLEDTDVSESESKYDESFNRSPRFRLNRSEHLRTLSMPKNGSNLLAVRSRLQREFSAAPDGRGRMRRHSTSALLIPPADSLGFRQPKGTLVECEEAETNVKMSVRGRNVSISEKTSPMNSERRGSRSPREPIGMMGKTELHLPKITRGVSGKRSNDSDTAKTSRKSEDDLGIMGKYKTQLEKQQRLVSGNILARRRATVADIHNLSM